MTATSERIVELLSFGLTDWRISGREQAEVARLVAADPDLDATVRDLQASNDMIRVFNFMGATEHRRTVTAYLATRTRSQTSTARNALIRAGEIHRISGSNPRQPYTTFVALDFFDICRSLSASVRGFGFATRTLSAGSPAASASRANRAQPFTGSAATGVNPSTLSVPPQDQAALAAERLIEGDQATERRYGNPSLTVNLVDQLRALTPAQRTAQASTMVRQPISTLFAEVYGGRPPIRSRVIRLAADHYQLEPELVAALMLTEGRDQTRNADAKDYTAATSVLSGNTSLGLGQVVVSTARNGDLFEDLLSPGLRSGLSHRNIAALLVSDEFNIFAVAKYIRAVADAGSRIPASRLPTTTATYSPTHLPRYDNFLSGVLATPVDKTAIDMPAFARHSSRWPEANIMALASEYTSTAWDDELVELWSAMVLPAYRTLKRANLF